MIKIDNKVITVADAKVIIQAKIPLAKFVNSSDDVDQASQKEEAEVVEKSPLVEINYKILEIKGGGKGSHNLDTIDQPTQEMALSELFYQL